MPLPTSSEPPPTSNARPLQPTTGSSSAYSSTLIELLETWSQQVKTIYSKLRDELKRSKS